MDLLEEYLREMYEIRASGSAVKETSSRSSILSCDKRIALVMEPRAFLRVAADLQQLACDVLDTVAALRRHHAPEIIRHAAIRPAIFCNRRALSIAVPNFASDQDRKDFTRRVKKQVSADSSATVSVRLAGTSDFKAKYAGNFPKVAIIDAASGRMTTPEALESLGLVAPRDPAPTVVRFKTSRNHSPLGTERSWPD